MRYAISTVLFIALWIFTITATASGPTELHLWKKDPNLYGSCGNCAEFFPIRENDSPSDITEFNLYNQTGYYYIDLDGPAGTTVTLFGKQKHSAGRGFIIVRKKDDTPISVEDLESFPPNQWVEVAAQNLSSGAYSVWYQPYGGFKQNINSVRWGQWWTHLPTASGKE